MRIALVSIAMFFALLAPAAAGTNPFPGFSCRILAQRQPFSGSSTADFRVVKLTYMPGAQSVEHRHKYGEILYLLSGSGTSTITHGATTALSKDRAIVIPPETYHRLTQIGRAPLVVLTVQFPRRRATAFEGRPTVSDQCK